jgi:uncharacterized protein YaiL (DUF2058 family)
MSMSLRDQLIQAGLVSEKQARAATEHKRAPQVSRKKPPPVSEQQRRLQQAQAEKAARDQALNRKQLEKAERRARRAEIRQLVEQHRVAPVESDDWYNFVDGSKIKRMPVTPALRASILSGDLIIVRSDNHYDLVPIAAAERIRERDPSAVIKAESAAPAPAAAEDQAYQNFVVPDDLMW